MEEEILRRRRGVAKEQILLRATKNWKFWRAKIAQVLNGHGT